MNPVNPVDLAQLKNIIEAAVMTAASPISVDHMLKLFSEEEQVEREAINTTLEQLSDECESRGLELKQVASGYRYQAKQGLSPWLSRVAEERPSRYSRALLETLALVVYRQPVTRAEIEDVRGVAVSSSIIKTLLEREWVRVVGHRDVPGKPALYGTTRQFLDYFNLKGLSELPPLAEIRSLDSIQSELELTLVRNAGEEAANAESIDDESAVTVATDGAGTSEISSTLRATASTREVDQVVELEEGKRDGESDLNDSGLAAGAEEVAEERNAEETEIAEADLATDDSIVVDPTEKDTISTVTSVSDQQAGDDPLATKVG